MTLPSDAFSFKCEQDSMSDMKTCKSRMKSVRFSHVWLAAAAIGCFPSEVSGRRARCPWLSHLRSLALSPAACLLSQPRTRQIEPPVCSPSARARRCNQASAVINHELWTLRRAAPPATDLRTSDERTNKGVGGWRRAAGSG